jgi:hypothetical protein
MVERKTTLSSHWSAAHESLSIPGDSGRFEHKNLTSAQTRRCRPSGQQLVDDAPLTSDSARTSSAASRPTSLELSRARRPCSGRDPILTSSLPDHRGTEPNVRRCLRDGGSTLRGLTGLPGEASPAKVAKEEQHNDDDDQEPKPGRHGGSFLPFGRNRLYAAGPLIPNRAGSRRSVPSDPSVIAATVPPMVHTGRTRLNPDSAGSLLSFEGEDDAS